MCRLTVQTSHFAYLALNNALMPANHEVTQVLPTHQRRHQRKQRECCPECHIVSAHSLIVYVCSRVSNRIFRAQVRIILNDYLLKLNLDHSSLEIMYGNKRSRTEIKVDNTERRKIVQITASLPSRISNAHKY